MGRSGHSWVQWVNKLWLRLKYGNLEERFWNFDYLGAAKIFNPATDCVGFSGMPCIKHVTVEPASIGCAGSEL